MMVAGGEKERGQGGKKKKKKALQQQTITWKTVTRQVKTRLHLPTLSSYHIMYLSDFPTCKTKRSHPLWSTICWLLQRNDFWSRCNLTSCALPLTFKVLKIFSKLRFTSILIFMLNWIKAVCININKLQDNFSNWKLYPHFYLVLDYFLKAKYNVCKNKKFSRRGRHSTSLSEFLK